MQENNRSAKVERGSALVLLFVGFVFVSHFLSPVSAFQAIDEAMCKNVDVKTNECQQKTNEFQLTDEWAFFWIKGKFETSDVGTKAGFAFYDPGGNLFHSAPCDMGILCPAYQGAVIDWRIRAPGAVVGWMGIHLATEETKFFLSITPTTVTASMKGSPPSSKPGEWRAEFTLDGKVVVTERFSIGTVTTATSASSLEESMNVIASDVTGTQTNLARFFFRLSLIPGGDLCFEDVD